MKSHRTKQIEAPVWPEDMSFEAFRRTIPIGEESVYELFFDANQERISVQNRKLAVPKLKLILESVFQISSRRGFHAMSLRDLCEATGLSMGAMYNYIRSKEELANMVTEMVGAAFVDVNQPLLPTGGLPGARLEAMIRAHIYMSELFRPWYFFVYMETKNLPPDNIKRAIQVEQDMLDQMQSLIAEGEREGIYAPMNTTLVAAACQSLIQDWYLKTWHFKGSDMDATTYADFVLDSTHRLLGYK